MFDIHQKIFDEYGEQKRQYEYIDGLMKTFAESPEAQPILADRSLRWAALLVEYYFIYIGGELGEMSLPDFNEVVFSLFPQKVSTLATSAPVIVNELKAFWSFLKRQYDLKSAEPILAAISEEASEQRLRQRLSDRSNWGMAKSFVMAGIEAGYDMTTQEGAEAFQKVYNAQLEQRRVLMLPPLDKSMPLHMGGPTSSKEDRNKKRQERKRKKDNRKRKRK